ncbi:MAG: T9SS type A sorting domain-containing protein, partial [Bacteroidia bacterium]|nr:T9SS type A sorting domain-containing protein [Bacteroidia bacterium]
TWFLGSVGGGVWHTEDAGDTWNLLTPDISSMATSTLAMAASNNDVIYAGTGEGIGSLPAIVGTGIYKSTDRGQSWNILEATSNNNQFAYISRIIINPDDENELLVCTRSKRFGGSRTSHIFKSTDGGITWEDKLTRSNTLIQQLVPSPDDFNILYATLRGVGVYSSSDAGETWTPLWGVVDGERRIEMAISPQDAGVAYLSCEIDDGSSLYYTRDTFRTVTKAIFEGRQPNWLASQGWYDNTLAVHPYNDSIVWVAGQSSMMEIELGNTFGTVLRYDTYENNTSFIHPIDNSSFSDEAGGEAISLFAGLPVNLEITEDDLVEVEIRFGDSISSMAHLVNVDLINFGFTYDTMISVPFLAWDLENDRQIAMSIFDTDGNGEWSFEDYSDQSNPFHDVVVTNNVPYADTANTIIATQNVLYKGQYYFFMGRSVDYEGPRDTLPEGTIKFKTIDEEGLISSFGIVTDGYGSYADIDPVGSKGVHVDHHNIIFLPRDSASGLFYVMNANDGGIAFSTDSGNTFRQTGDLFNNGNVSTINGLNTSQFYGVDKMNGANRYIGGTQDNGTWISPVDPDSETPWQEAPSGDGFECAWHYENPNLILETSQFNNLFKSYDEGITWRNIELPDSGGPFLTRLASSQLNPDLIFMVSDSGLLRSPDFAETWEVIKMPTNWDFHPSYGAPTAISLADPNIVWSGSQLSGNSRISYSTDAGLSFQPARHLAGTNLGNLSGLTTHPSDPNTAYALFSQKSSPKVLVTHDLGTSWDDLSGYYPLGTESNNGFPDVAVYCLLVMPWDEERIWVGTEIGIFESLDGGDNWSYADNGLSSVAVWQMKIVNDEIVLATHGRGIFTVNIQELQLVSVDDIESSLKGKLSVSPNPLQDISRITFQLNEERDVKLSLISMDGKHIKTLFSGKSGTESKTFEIRKGVLKSGMYLLQLQTREGRIVEKMIVI